MLPYANYLKYLLSTEGRKRHHRRHGRIGFFANERATRFHSKHYDVTPVFKEYARGGG